MRVSTAGRVHPDARPPLLVGRHAGAEVLEIVVRVDATRRRLEREVVRRPVGDGKVRAVDGGELQPVEHLRRAVDDLRLQADGRGGRARHAVDACAIPRGDAVGRICIATPDSDGPWCSSSVSRMWPHSFVPGTHPSRRTPRRARRRCARAASPRRRRRSTGAPPHAAVATTSSSAGLRRARGRRGGRAARWRSAFSELNAA